MNFIPAINIDAFKYSRTLFNFMERPTEINSKIVLIGIKNAIMLLKIIGLSHPDALKPNPMMIEAIATIIKGSFTIAFKSIIF